MDARARAVALCTLLSLFSGSAVSAAWEIVSTGNAGAVVYVDEESIVEVDAATKAWFLFDYAKPRESSDVSGPMSSSKNFVGINCAQRTLATFRQISYSGNLGAGEVVSSVSVRPLTAAYEEVVPESIGESMLKFICKRKERQTEILRKTQKDCMTPSQVGQAIVNAIPHKAYPDLAKRRGWQGTVDLTISYKNGVFSGIRLARSSGYGVLDDAAIGSLNRGVIASRLTNIPGHCDHQTFDLVKPFSYRLTDQ